MSLDKYLSAKSRDRHSISGRGSQWSGEESVWDNDDGLDADQVSDDIQQPPPAGAQVKQVQARKLPQLTTRDNIIKSHYGQVDHSWLFEGWVLRKVLLQFKQAYLKIDWQSAAVYKDEFVTSPIKQYGIENLRVQVNYAHSQDGKIKFQLGSDWYAATSPDQLERIQYAVERRGADEHRSVSTFDDYYNKPLPSQVEGHTLSPQSEQHGVISSTTELSPKTFRVSVTRKNVAELDEADLDKQQVQKRISIGNLKDASKLQVEEATLSSHQPTPDSHESQVSKALVFNELQLVRDEIKQLASQIEHKTDFGSNASVVNGIMSKLDVINGNLQQMKQEAVQQASEVPAIKDNEINDSLQDVQLTIQNGLNEVKQQTSQTSQLISSQLKFGNEAISNSLMKIIEYLANNVDVQNKADVTIHAKVDKIHKYFQTEPKGNNVTDRLMTVERELVQMSRNTFANKLDASKHNDVSSSLKKELAELLAVVKDIKRNIDTRKDDGQTGNLLSRVEEINGKLGNYLVSTNQSNTDVSKLTSDISVVVNSVKELSNEVNAFRSELRTPSPTREFRSSSPTRGMNGSESIAIMNQLMDMSKSMGVLRNQVSDLGLHNSTAQANILRLLGGQESNQMQRDTGITQIQDAKEMAEIKSLLQQMSTEHSISHAVTGLVDNIAATVVDQNNKKFDSILQELEHMQYGFQNQMTSYRKSLANFMTDKEVTSNGVSIQSSYSTSTTPSTDNKFELAKEMARLEIQVAALKNEKQELHQEIEREVKLLQMMKSGRMADIS